MHHATFLHIAAVFNNDFAPVATQGSKRTDIYVFANNHIASYGGLRMNICGRMHYGFDAVEFVKHILFLCCKGIKNIVPVICFVQKFTCVVGCSGLGLRGPLLMRRTTSTNRKIINAVPNTPTNMA